MTQTAYDTMTREQLIGALVDHDATLSEIYAIIHLDNKEMAPGEKIFWIAARSVLASEKPNEHGLVRLPIDDICAFNGMSDTSNNGYATNLINRYGAKKETVPYVTKKGQARNLTYIDRKDSVWREPWTIDLPEEKKRTINGNGKYCEHCKTYNLQVKTQRLTYQEIQECECCGYKKVSPILADEDHKPLDPMEYIPEKKGPQAEEPFSESSEPPKGPQPEDLFPTSETSIEKKLENPGPLRFPDTPPHVEGDATQLLLEIAGEHTEFIEMIPTPQKYSTVHRSLTLEDIQDHQQGGKPKGTRLYRSDGMTRSLVFDEDTAEGFERLKEAARLLVAADDFKPMLEPTPEGAKHTGGKLFIIFDADVDRYSAKQTCYQYTGNLLRQCKEVWPPETDTGNRVRLPGGTYIHPNFTAQCHLLDEHMQNGIGNAAMMLTRQTPAEVVIDYPKPAPTPEPQRAKPAPRQGGYLEPDLAKQYVADFNAMTAWSDIVQLAGGFIRGKFLAVWRNDTTPNMAIWSKADMAKDFARLDEPLMDKYDVWCHIMAHERGQDWREFKRRDLEERCAYRRAQLERRAL